MPGSCFAERLGDLIDLSAAERAALARLEERERLLKRGTVLVRENDRTNELYILKRGTMMSYTLLGNGSRQILRFLFPGEIPAATALVYRESPETVVALSDCVVAAFDRAAFAALMTDHPRFAALIVATDQIERVALTDRLAGIGRTSARARVAALLLDIRDSLRRIDRSITTSFALGLTQEEIGDATGLTAVHVNRMLRRLEADGLIARENSRVTVLDEAALAREANHVDRSKGLDLSWLPSAR